MPEDEFDFTGENPAELLPIYRKRAPAVDYHSRLQQQGHTQESPPDLGGLFKALASEYVPTRVVRLPPKVVTRVSLRPGDIGDLFGIAILLYFYLMIVGCLGLLIPYSILSSFEVKAHMRPGGTCTITGRSIEQNTDDNNQVYYTVVVNFTLRTPTGKSYQAHEYQRSSFDQRADAQQYLTYFGMHQSYICWYDTIDPTVASFYEVKVGFWDYFWLAFGLVLFLILGVLPNVLIARAFLGDLIRGDIELVW